MNAAEIKEYIEQNSDDTEVQSLVDSLADKRVNQARQKWETELPERVDTAIAEREQREQQQRERRIHVSEQLGQHFTEAGLQPEWVEPFLPEDLATIEDDAIPELAEEITATVQDLREKMLSNAYTNRSAPKGGSAAAEPQDPKKTEFRKAMGLDN